MDLEELNFLKMIINKTNITYFKILLISQIKTSHLYRYKIYRYIS